MTRKYLSPAKLNLFLHIIGQRADGYHLLQTVFQLLDYYDELTFTLRDDQQINLTCNINEINNENNLVLRAAHLLKQQQGVDIHLHKNIPMGGGLGGGSSNAATTLIALNHLWQLQLSTQELLALGLKLGADVPVFIQGQSAWAEGIGEVLVPIELPERWFVVLAPPVLVSTPKLFSDNELTRNTSPIKIQEFLEGAETQNDCEVVCSKRYPEVAAALTWLNQFAPARLTGTGGCVFAAVKNEQTAKQIAEQIPKPFTGFYAKGINCSPLLELSK